MNCIRKITDDLLWVGGNDHRLQLFENAYPVPQGMGYNAYLLLDEQTALLDAVDPSVADVFFDNLEAGLGGRELNYVVVNHMEPDHSGALRELLRRYPDATVAASEKAFGMMRRFFGDELPLGNVLTVGENSRLCLGRHTLRFLTAPMVHWPEVTVAYDEADHTLFSADAFGAFGATDGALFDDESDFDRDWLDEARRYYTNIVGKYGGPVQALLTKAAALDLRTLCPLHGPIWRRDIGRIVEKYRQWSAYEPESDGVLIAYASVYGHTALAAQVLARELRRAGAKETRVYDVSKTHPSELVAQGFRYARLAFLSATYNAGIFPAMETLLLDVKAHGLKNRRVALVENGSWAPVAGKLMKDVLDGMKGMQVLEPVVRIPSAMRAQEEEALAALAQELMK